MCEVEILLESIDDAKQFVHTISSYDGDFALLSGKYIVDAKSILGLFSVDLSKSVTLRIDVAASKMEEVLHAIEKYYFYPQSPS